MPQLLCLSPSACATYALKSTLFVTCAAALRLPVEEPVFRMCFEWALTKKKMHVKKKQQALETALLNQHRDPSATRPEVRHNLDICIYMCVYICVCVCVYIYIYM